MLRTRNHFDCIIIGGGPAGSTLAMTLAGWGRRVAVIEETPRDARIEVEDLPAEARPMVKRLGLGAALRHSAGNCPRRRMLIWGDGHPSKDRLEADHFALRVDRSLFDADLRGMARALGVEIFEPARVSSELPESGRGTIEITTPDGPRRLRAEVFVVATGRRSDARIMPLSVDHAGPDAWAFVAPARSRGGRARFDAIESLPYGFLRWQATSRRGGWGQVAVIVDRERAEDDPDEVIAEALTRSGIAFGVIEVQDARRFDVGPRLVSTKLPVFLVGSAAVAIDPLLGRGLAAAVADGELAAVAVNTAIENPDERRALLAHEQKRQADRHRAELAAALGIYLREVRFSDQPFWYRRHEAVEVRYLNSEVPTLPERLRVAGTVGRYQVWERRGDLLESVVGWGLPGGPVKQQVHRVPIEPLIALVERAQWTDDVVGLAGRDARLCAHSRQTLLQALHEMIRLGILEHDVVPD